MKLLNRTFAHLPRFFKSQSGSAMPMISLGIFALVGSMGVAVDMGRLQVAQSRMSSALDAAGLAAGSNISTTNLTTEVTKYFNANFPPHYMGTQIDTLSVSASSDKTLITLQAHGIVDMTFMRIFGITSKPIEAHSQITRTNVGMELVLVMDNTGSMSQTAGGGMSKLKASKDAATELVNILFGSGDTPENLWIGLVPFAQAVNIGSARGVWTTNAVFNWGPTSWMGCVDARETGGRDVTDDPPTPATATTPDMRFPKYYWPCNNTNNGWFGTNGSHNNCNTGSGLQYKSGLDISLGPNKSCSQAVTPMTSNKSTILSGISSMQAVGNTHIVVGASWGWRMLSPRWRNRWGGEMNTKALPQDYDTPLMNKVMILMTDGDNTIDSNNRGAYGYLSDGKLGTTNSSAAVTQLNNRLTQVCTSMKSHGVLIYTIAFGTDVSTSAKNILKACASKTDYFFYSPSSNDLQTAFHLIGDSLANLRISQ